MKTTLLRTSAITGMLAFACYGSMPAHEKQDGELLYESVAGPHAGGAPQGRNFNPHEQQAVRSEKDGTRVTLLKNEPCATCASGSRLTLELTGPAAAAPRGLVLDGPAQVDEIYVVDATRAVIVGQAQASVGEVVVIDPRTVEGDRHDQRDGPAVTATAGGCGAPV